jgi:GxxExxY protein
LNKRQLNKLSFEIIACAIDVHKHLGPGLLEKVYEQCLVHKLTKSGLLVKQQVVVPVTYEDLYLEVDLKLDILVNNLVVVELKTLETILPVHQAQLLSYMKLLNVPKGVLINFFTEKITDSAIHVANDLFWNLPD